MGDLPKKGSVKETRAQIAAKVNATVAELLDEGASPSDLSFVLGMVATEFGLKVTEESLSVLLVVLSGVCQGVANAFAAAGNEEDSNGEEELPEGVTVH